MTGTMKIDFRRDPVENLYDIGANIGRLVTCQSYRNLSDFPDIRVNADPMWCDSDQWLYKCVHH